MGTLLHPHSDAWVVVKKQAQLTTTWSSSIPHYGPVTSATADALKGRELWIVKITKRNRAKRQNGRIKSPTVNIRTGRAAAKSAEQILQEIRKIQSPSIVPEIQQTEAIERYMVNEAEFIRTFGWWGLH
jgi:triacylglycerol esterase/lipase EstA (alpha/beta hydrolase family)